MSLGYEEFLAETGYKQEEIEVTMASLGNLPYDTALDASMDLKPSPIHGVGLFAAHNLGPRALVGGILRGGERAVAARYLNHSSTPNCYPLPMSEGGDVLLVTRQAVTKGTELTVNYMEMKTVAERIANDS